MLRYLLILKCNLIKLNAFHGEGKTMDRGMASFVDVPHHLPELLFSIILAMFKPLLTYYTVTQKIFNESR